MEIRYTPFRRYKANYSSDANLVKARSSFLAYMILLVLCFQFPTSCQVISKQNGNIVPVTPAPSQIAISGKSTKILSTSTVTRAEAATPFGSLPPSPSTTSTPTIALFRLFDQLVPGGSVIFNHSAYSMIEKAVIQLPGDTIFEGRLSPGGEKVVRVTGDADNGYYYLVTDLISGNQVKVPGVIDCNPSFSTGWSPDETMLISSCSDQIITQFFPNGKEAGRIHLDLPNYYSVQNPLWSLDGDWIAYIVSDHRADPSMTRDRIFVVRSTCLYESETCRGSTRFVTELQQNGYNLIDWASQNQLIILDQTMHRFIVYDVNHDKTLQEVTLPGQFLVSSFAISPNGKEILFGQLTTDEKGSAIYLVSLESGKIKQLYYEEGFRFINVYYLIEK